MSGYDDEPTVWELGNYAATALQSYYDERNGGMFDTYGDEGSTQFADAMADLLAGLMHLAHRADVDFAERMRHACVIHRNETQYNRSGGPDDD